MPDARIMIHFPDGSERELQLAGSVSLGRAFDNTLCINDANVSRYHAIIEQRGESFYVSDLDSRNGTAVNNIPIASDCELRDGDSISIGGVAFVEFHAGKDEAQSSAGSGDSAGASLPVTPAQKPSVSAPESGPPLLLIIGAAAGFIAVTVVVLLLAGVIGSSPDATVRIVYPESGATVRGPEMIRVEAGDAKKIERVIYLLDGVEFASAEFPPYDAQLDPLRLQSSFQNLAGGNHILTLVVEDKKGNRKPQPDTVVLAFEMSGTAPSDGKSDATDGGAKTDIPPTGDIERGLDVAALARNLVAQVSGKSGYGFEAEFVEQIRLRANDYRINLMDDARRYRREIASAFSSKGLSLPLGFVTAMSQSKFRDGAGETIGFWRVPRRVAIEQGYIAQDEPPSSLNNTKRAAEIAAAYMKELVNVFGVDDFMYAIACYGMPISQAAQVKAKIEESDPVATARKNFWSMVRSGVVPREGAERVVRFFAAGIVGENPKQFGINAEPLSSLY